MYANAISDNANRPLVECCYRVGFKDGFRRAEEDTINKAIQWLDLNFHISEEEIKRLRESISIL